MPPSKLSIVIPILIIVLGAGWLLTVLDILPGVDWVWVLLLGVSGLLTLAIGGINKVNIVIGPFLLVCTAASLLRQTGRLPIDLEVPALTIALGALMLAARLLPVPPPRWMVEATPPQR